MKNFGHRGFSGEYPENTMLAFEKACRTPGCDGIETDVHLTKDGEAVLIHDETVDRTCVNGRGWIKDMTYEELKVFDVSYTFAGKCEKQHIPTLREYFDLVKNDDVVTNIELKTGVLEYPGIEQTVYDLIREYRLDEKIIVSSFNHHSVLRFKKLAPHIKCGLLTDSWLIDAAAYVRKTGVECYHPFFTNMLVADDVRDLHESGIEINVWTVNEEAHVKMMMQAGADTVIGNYPDRAARVIAAG